MREKSGEASEPGFFFLSFFLAFPISSSSSQCLLTVNAAAAAAAARTTRMYAKGRQTPESGFFARLFFLPQICSHWPRYARVVVSGSTNGSRQVWLSLRTHKSETWNLKPA